MKVLMTLRKYLAKQHKLYLWKQKDPHKANPLEQWERTAIKNISVPVKDKLFSYTFFCNLHLITEMKIEFTRMDG